MARVRRLFLLACLVAVAGCGSSTTTTVTPANTVEQTGAVSHPREVTVHETEFRIDPAAVNAGSEGAVRITIVNDGKIPHALAVDGPEGEVDFDGQVDPGHTGVLSVLLDKPGTYRMWCPIDGHRGKGMVGTITVTGSGPASATDTGATTSTRTVTTPTTPTQTQTQTQTQTKTVTHTQTTTTSTGGGGYGY